jgi:glycosyltransferase involved in cell wall biosynthesis
MRGLAAELGVADAVRWLTEVPYEQLPEIYAGADVIVNFPHMDAFPVSFLEAAACMRPVVSCRLPSYRGTFAEHFFRMVEPDDVDGLARALTAEVNGEQKDRGLSEARDIVTQRYSAQSARQQLVSLYEEAICHRASRSSHKPVGTPRDHVHGVVHGK